MFTFWYYIGVQSWHWAALLSQVKLIISVFLNALDMNNFFLEYIDFPLSEPTHAHTCTIIYSAGRRIEGVCKLTHHS